MSPQETMTLGVVVIPGSRYRPPRVDTGGLSILGARGIKRGDGSVGYPHEAMTGDVVTEESCDRALRVDAGGPGARELGIRARACGARIEQGERAVACSQEAVKQTAVCLLA